MSGSMGYILANWTTELIKQGKKKKRKTRNNTKDNEVQTEGLSCEGCARERTRASTLESDLATLKSNHAELRSKLAEAEIKAAASEEIAGNALDLKRKYSLLANEKAKAASDEDTALRAELEEIKQNLSQLLDERDEAHSQRIKLLEQVMADKDYEWAKKNEKLQRDLRSALRSNIQDSSRESESVKVLEQEISSLHSVIEMRVAEIHDLRRANHELNARVEHVFWLEAELGNAKQRLEELGLVVQNKMQAERELVAMTEGLQQELDRQRMEAQHYRHELENRQYLYNNQQPETGERPHKNTHQKLWW